MAEKGDVLDIFTGMPTLHWSDFPIGKDIWHLVLLDAQNYREWHGSNNKRYPYGMWKAVAFKESKEPRILKGRPFMIILPAKGFHIAYNRYTTGRMFTFRKGMPDLKIVLGRPNRKKIKIHEMECIKYEEDKDI